MAVYTELGKDDLQAIARAFGLPPGAQARPEPKGSINSNYHLDAGGERYFLRVNEGKAFADVEWEAQVCDFLAAARFPVPRVLRTPEGRAWVERAGKAVSLFEHVSGEELTRETVTPAHCGRIGEQLGRLHALADAFSGERPNPYGPARVGAWLHDLEASTLGGSARAEWDLPLLREEWALAEKLPHTPRGLVHGDLFVDNVLWIGDRVASVLDWEMSCVEPFVWDVAVTLNAWCYSDRYEPARVNALLAGYRSKRKLKEEELAALYPWARFGALRYTVSRILDFGLSKLKDHQLFRKDWHRYRDRLKALRKMGEAGFRELVR
jgi:homoserine kinase type II